MYANEFCDLMIKIFDKKICSDLRSVLIIVK